LAPEPDGTDEDNIVSTGIRSWDRPARSQSLYCLRYPAHVFNKYSNIIFNENASSGSRGVSCRRIGGQTDVTNLIVAFRNFVNAPYSPTAHTINRPPLSVTESKCVMDKFLISKFHDPKIENLIIFGPTLKIKFMSHFRKLFQKFAKKYFDEFIVICW
jgi:hypothetical protein